MASSFLISLPPYIVFCAVNVKVFALGSRTSALIANAMRLLSSMIRSAPNKHDGGQRVSGKIFPAHGRQIRQLPGGRCCSRLSQKPQRSRISFASCLLRLERNLCLSLSFKELTKAALKSGNDVFGVSCRSGVSSDGT